MKKFMKTGIILLLVTPIMIEAAISSGRMSYQTSTYNGTEYRIFLSAEQINQEYQNFDINNSPLPKPLHKIISIAREQIKKVDRAASWKIYSITLQEGHYSNSKYWYYRIQFRDSNQYFTILVTLDGKPGKIVKVLEEPLE